LTELSPRAIAWLSWLRPTALLGRLRLGLLVSLVVLTIVAWLLTIYHAVNMSMPMGIAVRGAMSSDGAGGMEMPGMASGWSVGDATVFTAVWTVMMAAMMLPAVAPVASIFASAQARREKKAAVSTAIFLGGHRLGRGWRSRIRRGAER
jgi:predicted metal-binding membrane protein